MDFIFGDTIEVLRSLFCILSVCFALATICFLVSFLGSVREKCSLSSTGLLLAGTIVSVILCIFCAKSVGFMWNMNQYRNYDYFYIEKIKGKYSVMEGKRKKERLTKETAEKAITDKNTCKEKEKNVWECSCFYDQFTTFESCIVQNKAHKRTFPEMVERVKQERLLEKKE